MDVRLVMMLKHVLNAILMENMNLKMEIVFVKHIFGIKLEKLVPNVP